MTDAALPLFRSLAAALLLATLVFVCFVLPAEYDLDPTGAGAALGIKGMSGYQVNALTNMPKPGRSDSVTFVLAPFESIEYKYHLASGAGMTFTWTALGKHPDVIFDMHSEEVGGDPEDAVSFDKGRSDGASGTFVAPFGGIHGWYWENRSASNVAVRLTATGFFNEATVFGPGGAHSRRLAADPPD